ncbi:MAG: ATP-binding protein [Desulforhopalus sp.]|nr:ATP-binding protein [Desulforhopalus sp.]
MNSQQHDLNMDPRVIESELYRSSNGKAGMKEPCRKGTAWGKRWKYSLRAKVSLLFLALTLMPLLIIGYFSHVYAEQLLIKMVVRQLENVAEDKVSLLTAWLEERRADMSMVAETSLVVTMDSIRINPYLDLIREKYDVYRELVVVSGTGKIIAASPPNPADRTRVWDSRYQVRENLYVSDITYASDEEESFFLIGAPVPATNDVSAGMVYGRVGTDKIINSILKVSLGATGECYLVDREGRFLAHKEPRRILTENISQSESFRKIFEKSERAGAYLDYRGIEVLGTSLQVGDTNWYIVVEQDRDEAFAAADRLKGLLWLAFFLCIVSAFFFASMISSHIVAPIRKLSLYAARVADSRFDESLEKSGRHDEIGTLFYSVTDMATRLRERHLQLEEKVGQQEAELKETDLMLQKTRLMAERSEKFAAMGRMGAAVAHEIRTPLTSIKLFLESVQDEVSISAEFEEDFTIAMNQIGRIEGTVNRFLDFAKPQDLVFADIDLKTFLVNLLTMVRPQINRQECVLSVSVDDRLPTIIGDRKLLAEALINVLVNALDALPVHGTLSVSAKQDTCVIDGREISCVRIDIADTGQGIATDHMNKIFEPFFTTKTTGTGLGLPLVLTTIRNHGGVVRVTSNIGQGTVFSIFLPVSADTISS